MHFRNIIFFAFFMLFLILIFRIINLKRFRHNVISKTTIKSNLNYEICSYYASSYQSFFQIELHRFFLKKLKKIFWNKLWHWFAWCVKLCYSQSKVCSLSNHICSTLFQRFFLVDLIIEQQFILKTSLYIFLHKDSGRKGISFLLTWMKIIYPIWFSF